MPPTYSWDKHPEAVLGTVYLYLAYARDPKKIPAEVISAFVARHQEGTLLDDAKVRAAISAVRGLDGGPGLGSSRLLRDIWNALAPSFPG